MSNIIIDDTPLSEALFKGKNKFEIQIFLNSSPKINLSKFLNVFFDNLLTCTYLLIANLKLKVHKFI